MVLILFVMVLWASPGASGQIPARGEVSESVGMNIHFTDARAGEMEMLASTGVRWIRMDLIWKNTERQRGQYDFSAYDRLMASLAAQKIKALFILDYANPLYDQGRFPSTDEARGAFVRWAMAGVRHFRGKGILWEMWNEPNIASGGLEKVKVEDYAKLALDVGKAMKKDAPKETYIGPATSLIDLPFLEGCFKAGLLRYWSGVTVHPYRMADPETVGAEYEKLRALIAQYAPAGRVIPIISGEWGYASVGKKLVGSGAWVKTDDESQGERLAREWLINVANDIPLSIWYDWHDDGPDPDNLETHYGMVLYPYHEGQHPVYTPKPTYYAARTVTGLLKSYSYEKTLGVGQPGDYVLVFRRGKSLRIAAWTVASSPHAISVPVHAKACSLIGYKGEEKGILPTTQGEVRVDLSPAPQYLVCGNAGSHPAGEAGNSR